MTDYDGHTVALPLTQEQALDILWNRLDDACECESNSLALDAILSAPPEVLAPALGGWVKRHKSLEGRTLIVLPPSEVDGEGDR